MYAVMTSERCVGPLKSIAKQPFKIPGFFGIPRIDIGYIGMSRMGKTRAIKSLTYALGGIYQERVDVLGSRTYEDSSYVFAESRVHGSPVLVRIALTSYSDHSYQATENINAL